MWFPPTSGIVESIGLPTYHRKAAGQPVDTEGEFIPWRLHVFNVIMLSALIHFYLFVDFVSFKFCSGARIGY